ncbi:MAG: hypothetical protein H0X24_21395 [Ktedonobacterales bacterium]|nr:hypothetical protein [Ktedonobacterales bacterium]
MRPVTTPTHPKYTLAEDIYGGAVRGDFDEHLGMAGYITQAALAFVPIVGQVCAARDFIADRRKGDTVGAILNLFVFFPFLGGLSKVALALRGIRRLPRFMNALSGPPQPPAA